MAGGPDGDAENAPALYEEGRAGETEILKAARAEMKRNYYFASAIDQPGSAFIKAEAAFLLDEKNPRKEGWGWVEILTVCVNGRYVRPPLGYA